MQLGGNELVSFPERNGKVYHCLRWTAIAVAVFAFTLAAMANGWPRPWPMVHLISWAFWVTVSMAADWEIDSWRKSVVWPRREVFLLMDIYIPISTAMVLFADFRPNITVAAVLVFAHILMRGVAGWMAIPVALGSLFSNVEALESMLMLRTFLMAAGIIGIATICGLAWRFSGAWLWHSLLTVPLDAGEIEEVKYDDESG